MKHGFRKRLNPTVYESITKIVVAGATLYVNDRTLDRLWRNVDMAELMRQADIPQRLLEPKDQNYSNAMTMRPSSRFAAPPPRTP